MNYSEIVKVVDKDTMKQLAGETIVFSDLITKINKKLVEQERMLIITDKALYNFKKKSLKRRIPVKDLYGITTSKTSNEFVIHGDADEYDYHYSYINKRKIIQILAAVYFTNTSRKLRFFLVKDQKLSNYVTQCTEKRRNKNLRKIKETSTVDIDEYLYGNFMRVKTISHQRKSIKYASVMKTQKTEIVYLNEESEDMIKRLIDLKIENFRILGTLIKSYYGKIIWCEFIPNNTFYLMRVINSSDLNTFITDINKVIKLYATKEFLSISSPECIIKTEDKTFFLNKFEPYFQGGPLFYHLKHSGTFCEQKIKVISAEIINIILFFHKNGKNHLNFSPENFILDTKGFINYLWFEIDEEVFQKSNNLEILKPEEYSKINNDWYNLGLMIYEMLFYVSPSNFIDKSGNIHYPKFIEVSEESKEFLEKLLKMKDENDEIELEEIKKYRFFEGIDFDEVLNRKIDPVIVPMNLEIQKQNNLGVVIDDNDQENSEMERYTLFNYDSFDEEENEE